MDKSHSRPFLLLVLMLQQQQVQLLIPTRTFCKSTLPSSTETRTASFTPGRLSEVVFSETKHEFVGSNSNNIESCDCRASCNRLRLLLVRKLAGENVLLFCYQLKSEISKEPNMGVSPVSMILKEGFEEIFRKHARRHADALTSNELDAMLKANRVPKDYSGWVGSYVEWKLLYYLGKDKNGLLHKGTVRGVYDGSLFHQMEKEHSSCNAL